MDEAWAGWQVGRKRGRMSDWVVLRAYVWYGSNNTLCDLHLAVAAGIVLYIDVYLY